MVLLSRTEFRQGVFERDGYKCVICNGVDDEMAAHHIVERKLFKDGGYYLDNGATLCGRHHWDAERGVLTCAEIRKAAKIKTVVLPSEFDPLKIYDKWGKVELQ